MPPFYVINWRSAAATAILNPKFMIDDRMLTRVRTASCPISTDRARSRAILRWVACPFFAVHLFLRCMGVRYCTFPMPFEFSRSYRSSHRHVLLPNRFLPQSFSMRVMVFLTPGGFYRQQDFFPRFLPIKMSWRVFRHQQLFRRAENFFLFPVFNSRIVALSLRRVVFESHDKVIIKGFW